MIKEVYLTEWINGIEGGVLGIFSTKEMVDKAISADQNMYPHTEYNHEYRVRTFNIDEFEQ